MSTFHDSQNQNPRCLYLSIFIGVCTCVYVCMHVEAFFWIRFRTQFRLNFFELDRLVGNIENRSCIDFEPDRPKGELS